jgi:hypothetical protein
VDVDGNAIRSALRNRAPNVHFLQGDDWDDAYRQLKATVVTMLGVVHHLPDYDFASILSRLRTGTQEIPRIVTLDVSYFPGMYFNNLLSRIDRGNYVRRPEEYERLFKENGLDTVKCEFIHTKLRYVRYVCYHLLPMGQL